MFKGFRLGCDAVSIGRWFLTRRHREIFSANLNTKLNRFRTSKLVLSQVSFYCRENKIHATRTGKTKNVYRIMVRKLLSKIPLLRT